MIGFRHRLDTYQTFCEDGAFKQLSFPVISDMLKLMFVFFTELGCKGRKGNEALKFSCKLLVQVVASLLTEEI